MTVFIDSWAWIEFFRGTAAGKRAAQYIEGDGEVLVSAINVAEVLGYVLREGQDEKYVRFVKERAFVVPVSEDLAEEGARLKFAHRMGLADALVLASARASDAKVVTGDPDFKRFDDALFIG